MTKARRILHIGISSAEALGQRFIDTWQHAERNEEVEPYESVNFEDLATLLATLMPKRWELLQQLHRQGPVSIYALAKTLGRDYKNVHGDVKALAELGIIERDANDKILVPWDEINIEARIEIAA
jgi:predicted transcriptional regulator